MDMRGIRTLYVICLCAFWIPQCTAWRWWSRCYEDPPVGCFPTHTRYLNALGFAPESPEAMGMSFKLYKREQPVTVFSLSEASRILPGVYDSSLKTVAIVHGYLEDSDTPWITTMRQELLRREPMHVIVMDWGDGARNINYYQCVANTRMAGAMLAVLMRALIRLGGDPALFHLIGYSLGAHVSAQTGQRLPGLGRITGLDPAAPGFHGAHVDARLDGSDAVYVDVLHTDCRPVLGLGTSQSMGDVDYYVNGGVTQPGCRSVGDSLISLVSAVDQSLDAARQQFRCNHMRAVHLFSSTIRGDCQFPTWACNRPRGTAGPSQQDCFSCAGRRTPCPNLSYDLPDEPPARAGIFWVTTTSAQPYC